MLESLPKQVSHTGLGLPPSVLIPLQPDKSDTLTSVPY
jgi:hypothetical protein